MGGHGGSIFKGMGLRGGNRGREFSWNDVQGDKYKECYLGQSLHVRWGGRIQTGPKSQWWYKAESQPKGPGAPAEQSEVAKIKAEEEQLMKEALGLVPKRRKVQQGTGLEKFEYVELCKRGTMERDGLDTERVGGLGTFQTEQSGTIDKPNPLDMLSVAVVERKPEEKKRKHRSDRDKESDRSDRSSDRSDRHSDRSDRHHSDDESDRKHDHKKDKKDKKDKKERRRDESSEPKVRRVYGPSK